MNQAPPRTQQLDFPELLMAHLGHTFTVVGPIGVAVVVVVFVLVVMTELTVIVGLVASARKEPGGR